MAQAGTVTIEFFNIPRERAGRSELTVPSGTMGEVLAAVERACPGLRGLVEPDGRLARHYLVSLGGQCFISDLRHCLQPGERLWLLSADAGG